MYPAHSQGATARNKSQASPFVVAEHLRNQNVSPDAINYMDNQASSTEEKIQKLMDSDDGQPEAEKTTKVAKEVDPINERESPTPKPFEVKTASESTEELDPNLKEADQRIASARPEVGETDNRLDLKKIKYKVKKGSFVRQRGSSDALK